MNNVHGPPPETSCHPISTPGKKKKSIDPPLIATQY